MGFPLQTETSIHPNGSDIIIKDEKAKICKLVDISVLSDKIIAAKKFGKLGKYKGLEIQLNLKNVTPQSKKLFLLQ